MQGDKERQTENCLLYVRNFVAQTFFKSFYLVLKDGQAVELPCSSLICRTNRSGEYFNNETRFRRN